MYLINKIVVIKLGLLALCLGPALPTSLACAHADEDWPHARLPVMDGVDWKDCLCLLSGSEELPLVYHCPGTNRSFFHYPAQRSSCQIELDAQNSKMSDTPSDAPTNKPQETIEPSLSSGSSEKLPSPPMVSVQDIAEIPAGEIAAMVKREPSENHQQESCCSGKQSAMTPDPYERLEFAAPAFFPLGDYDTYGAAYAKPGLVILEGMTLTFIPGQSQYELTFDYEPPVAPVELRMQLFVRPAVPDDCVNGQQVPSARHAWFTITVPLILLEKAAPFTSGTKQARVAGYSSALKHLFFDPQSHAPTSPMHLDIRRSGVARFGHGFDRVDGFGGR